MIYVKDLPITNFKDLEIIEEVSGSLTLSFTSFNFENAAHHLLKEEAIVNVDGYDFVIKQINESTYAKQVDAVSTFFRLGGMYTHEIYGGTRTIRQFLDFAFKDTGWTYSFTGNNPYIFIPNFGESNKLQLIQGLCEVAKIEYKIMPNNHVILKEKIGADNNAQYRYGHNISALNKTVDTTNLYTKAVGIGANGLKVTYKSPYIEQFGVIEAEPIINEDIDDKEMLLELVKQEITGVPELAIELDSIELKDKELGERVWLIYEPLKIEMQSRILQTTKTIRNGKLYTKSVVLGNHKPKTQTDLLAKQQVDIDKQNKINRSRFEQTNDRITMEVEEINGSLEERKAELEITANQIRSEVSHLDKTMSDKIIETNSRITQTTENLTGQFNKEIAIVKNDNKEMLESAQAEFNAGLDGLKNNITATKKDLDGKITRAESKIEQTKKDINLQLSEEVDGINQVIDDLNNVYTKKEAQLKLDLDSISTKVAADKKDLDGRITKAESSITQTATSLEAKFKEEINASEVSITNDFNNKLKDANIASSKKTAELKASIDGVSSKLSAETERLDGEITKAESSITQTATSLEASFKEEISQTKKELNNTVNQTVSKKTADLKASIDEVSSDLKSETKRLDGRINYANSFILQKTDEITTKVVDETRRLDGRINTANSYTTQTAESIRSEVRKDLSSYDSKINGLTNSVSRVEQTANSLSSKISAVERTSNSLDNKITSHSSEIRQLHNEISWKVSADDIASEINQTAQGVKIRASKIDMDGIVRLASSVELGTTTWDEDKAIKFNGTDAWIYSTGSNLTISTAHLILDTHYHEVYSPVSNRNGQMVLAPRDMWIGLQSDGRLRVSDGNQVRYFRPG